MLEIERVFERTSIVIDSGVNPSGSTISLSKS
jgi:hypothetical protein